MLDNQIKGGVICINFHREQVNNQTLVKEAWSTNVHTCIRRVYEPICSSGGVSSSLHGVTGHIINSEHSHSYFWFSVFFSPALVFSSINSPHNLFCLFSSPCVVLHFLISVSPTGRACFVFPTCSVLPLSPLLFLLSHILINISVWACSIVGDMFPKYWLCSTWIIS